MERASQSTMVVQESTLDGEKVDLHFHSRDGVVTIQPYLRKGGHRVAVSLKGIPASLSMKELPLVLDRLKKSAVESVGTGLEVLPSVTEHYDQWVKAFDDASGQHKDVLGVRIAHVRQWVEAYQSGLSNHDLEKMMIACNGLGQAYYQLGGSRIAMACFKKGLSLAVAMNRHDGIGAAYGNLGSSYHSVGQYQMAIEFFNKHLVVAKEIGDRQGQGSAYGNLGAAYQSLGQHERAIDFLNKHVSLAKEIGDQQGEGNAYANLGNAYQSLGQYQKAIKYHNKHLAIATEIRDPQGQGNAYGNLGNAYQSLGQYQKAIEYHNNLLTIAKKVGDRKGEGAAYGNLGNAFRSLGQYEKAIEHHNKHLVIAKEIGDRQGQGSAYGNLGNAYYSLRQYEKAIGFINNALDVAKAIFDRRGEGSAYGNLGNAFRSLGQYERAIEYHSNRLAVAKEIGDRQGEGAAYGNLGVAYDSLGQYEKAIENHNRCLAIAEEIGDRQGQGNAHGNLGNVYRSLGQYGKAIEFLNKHLAVSKEIGDRHGEGTVYNSLGVSYKGNTQPVEAEKSFRQSTEIFSEIQREFGPQNHDWKISIFEELFRPYRHLEALLSEQGRIQDALEVADSGRARALNSLLYHRLQSESASLTSSQMQDVARRYNATLLLYSCDSFKNEENAIWVISPSEIHHEKISLEGLKGKEGLLLPDFKDPEETRKLTQLWHAALIAPIEKLLPSDGRLIIVRDSFLHDLPFAILQDPERHYLIEKHTLSIAPSIATLDLVVKLDERQRPSRSNEIAVVQSLTTTNAENEVEYLEGHFEKLSLLEPLQATLQATTDLIQKVGRFHMIAHGNSEVKTNIHSVYSGGISLGDTYLYAEQLASLKLNADLAFLGACRSGRGKVQQEGVVGLTMALLAGGVSSVVGTHWDIPDGPTPDVVNEFYRALGDGMGKAEALRHAMLQVKKDYPNEPEKWGAFFLVGML